MLLITSHVIDRQRRRTDRGAREDFHCITVRTRASLAAILEERSERALPEKVNGLVATTTIEILNLRPAMSDGLPPPGEWIPACLKSATASSKSCGTFLKRVEYLFDCVARLFAKVRRLFEIG